MFYFSCFVTSLFSRLPAVHSLTSFGFPKPYPISAIHPEQKILAMRATVLSALHNMKHKT